VADDHGDLGQLLLVDPSATRQFAGQDQVHDLFIRGLLGQVVDIVAAVGEPPGLALQATGPGGSPVSARRALTGSLILPPGSMTAAVCRII